ncbi:hypothetical protein HaLaN_10732, partial [Haematococcus lacustris]
MDSQPTKYGWWGQEVCYLLVLTCNSQLGIHGLGGELLVGDRGRAMERFILQLYAPILAHAGCEPGTSLQAQAALELGQGGIPGV